MSVTVVVGGQAGSEGKGAVCGALHKREHFALAARVGGPNAGHTIYDAMGRRFPLRQVPVAAVADPGANLVIAAGSEVDFEVLRMEIAQLEEAGHGVKNRLFIDKEATVVEPEYARAEKEIATGTTGKGIGAARAARAVRKAKRVEDFPEMDLHCLDTQALVRERVAIGARVMLEGTQGYILGSHAGWYPHCTSGDCRAIDFMAAVGLPPMEVEVWVVLRTHPIRIAGRSGPLPGEMTWEDVGVEPEITTVTKKVRRVGAWNWEWAKASIEANRVNGGPKVALTFADYWWPALAEMDGAMVREYLPSDVTDSLREIEHELEVEIGMLGTGPDSQLILEGSW